MAKLDYPTMWPQALEMIIAHPDEFIGVIKEHYPAHPGAKPALSLAHLMRHAGPEPVDLAALIAKLTRLAAEQETLNLFIVKVVQSLAEFYQEQQKKQPLPPPSTAEQPQPQQPEEEEEEEEGGNQGVAEVPAHVLASIGARKEQAEPSTKHKTKRGTARPREEDPAAAEGPPSKRHKGLSSEYDNRQPAVVEGGSVIDFDRQGSALPPALPPAQPPAQSSRGLHPVKS